MNRWKLAIGLVAAWAWALGAGTVYGQHKHGEHAGHAHDQPDAHGQESAGHSHEKAAAHGGSVVMTKEFHFETVFTPKGIRLYVYDGEQNPMQAKHWKQGLVKGRVTIQFRQRSRKPISLDLKRAAPKVASADDVDARWYTCMMHPEVLNDGPGTCPICRMKLTPRKAEHEHGAKGHEKPGDLDESTGGRPVAQVAAPVLWLCPMHPEQNGRTKGKCTSCGMNFAPQDYLAAEVDLSGIKADEAKAVFRLTNLPGAKEKQTTFTQKVVLADAAGKAHDEHGDQGHRHDEP